MAIKCTSRKWCPVEKDFRTEYVMDSVDDAANLPKSCPGSMAIVAEGGAVFMVNASGEWKQF